MAQTISASKNNGNRYFKNFHFDPSPIESKAFHECGHQLEKLEFALAVAQTRGDQILSSALKAKIAELGGNTQEPGT